MKNESKNYIKIIKAVLILVISALVSVFVFATVMYFIEGGYEYSPLFATVSVAVGSLLSSMYLAKQNGKKGLLIGAAVGGTVFVILMLISLIVDSSALGINTLFRFIIIMLSSLIGGVVGVNKKTNEKYI